MEMTSTRAVAAPIDIVWAGLNDPALLVECIPGCEKIEPDGENAYRVVMSARIGPVAAKFNGRIRLSDLDPPRSYTLSFEGQGGAAGFAKGDAKVALVPALDTAATTLSYTVKAQVGGKIAQIGSRLIDGAAAKIADDFFTRFSERVAPPPAAVVEETGEIVQVRAGRAPGSQAWIRWVSLAIIVGIVAYLAIRGIR